MPICKGCGAKLGCGCQLVNGLCSACVAKEKAKEQEDAKSKISKLPGVYNN